MGEQRRERRYPSSPYPPHSWQTRHYRDGYDLAWKFVSTKGREWTLDYFAQLGGDNGAPHQVGFVDGARACVVYLAKAKVPDRDVVRMNRELEEKWRREAGSEPPY